MIKKIRNGIIKILILSYLTIRALVIKVFANSENQINLRNINTSQNQIEIRNFTRFDNTGALYGASSNPIGTGINIIQMLVIVLIPIGLIMYWFSSKKNKKYKIKLTVIMIIIVAIVVWALGFVRRLRM